VTFTLRRKRAEPTEHAELIEKLRNTAGSLKGWTVYGATGVDLKALLY